ncbi:MAG: cation:proton antiporter, partial [Acidimicrobiales bacterium]
MNVVILAFAGARHSAIGLALPTLVLVALVAVASPIIAEMVRRLVVVPEAIIQIVLGVVLGPDVLGVAQIGPVVTALSTLGLAYLMFLAGSELDLRQVHLMPSVRVLIGWLASLAMALGATFALQSWGLIDHATTVALCLTTTALTTLIPVLKDTGVFSTPLGTALLSLGAVGEFGPIVVATLLLSTSNVGLTSLLTLGFVAVAAAAGLTANRVRPPRAVLFLRRHLHSTSQLPVRLSLLLVLALTYFAQSLGLDILMGSFAAGVVVQVITAGEDRTAVTSKLDAIGYGFLVPIFFVVSGVTFDLTALFAKARNILLVPIFLIVLLLVRGLPAYALHRRDLARRQRLSLALYAATSLP